MMASRMAYTNDPWKSLRPCRRCGILTHPASLQLQCLLFIIGHTCINPSRQIPTSLPCSTDQSNQILPTEQLALLPRSIRLQLLLLLPAVDVCKLEKTAVTAGISMDDEVWQVLYNERIPHHFSGHVLEVESEVYDRYTPEVMLKVKKIKCSWKEAYFSAIFSFNQMQEYLDVCVCDYDHIVPDMLYCIYSFHDTAEVYQIFTDQTSSIHNVYRCTHKCPRLTPEFYMDKFESPSIPFVSDPCKLRTWYIPVIELAEILVNTCGVCLKHLTLSNFHLKEMRKYLDLDLLAKLFSALESITVTTTYRVVNDEDCDEFESWIKPFLDMVFHQNKCAISTVVVDGYFKDMFPYLINSPNCSLKQLEVTEDVRTQFEEHAIELIQHHQSLEKFRFSDGYGFIIVELACMLRDGEFIVSVADLLYRPRFKELALIGCQISFNTLLIFLRQFFSSPYSVSLSLELSCPEFDPLLESLPCNLEQLNKSLEFDDCFFSANFGSILPPALILNSLKLKSTTYASWNVIHSFANLNSIEVNKFTLACHDGTFITKDNITDILSLFRIVTTQEWDLELQFSFEDDAMDTFTSALPTIISCVQRFVLQTDFFYNGGVTPSVISLLEVIFLSLSSSKPAYFVFGFSWFELDNSIVQTVHETWKRCGAVKLKRFEVFLHSARPRYHDICAFKMSLYDMAMAQEVIVKFSR